MRRGKRCRTERDAHLRPKEEEEEKTALATEHAQFPAQAL